MRRLMTVSAVLVVGILGVQGAAGAQTGYPGTVVASDGTVTVPAQVVSTTAGSSTTTTAIACGFSPGSTVTFTIAGSAGGTVTADSATSSDPGCATLTIVTTDPHISVNGSTPVEVAYGSSSIAVTGTGPTGAAVTDTVVVPVVQAAASSSSSGLAFTGADIMATVVGGLALIALGFLVLTFSRRRQTVS